MEQLFQSIQQRRRPEDVLRAIVDFRGSDLTHGDKSAFGKITRYSRGLGWSSMYDRFRKADNLEPQILVAMELFPHVELPADVNSPVDVSNYIGRLMEDLGVSGLDFKADRPNREKRLGHSVYKSHRAYNKRFRLVFRLHRKYDRWLRNRLACDLAQVAKTRLANRIEWDDFKQDVDTACFVTYFTARLARRSIFTWGAQDRPYDRAAERLFQKLGDDANWWVVAHVHPVPEVVEHLTEEQKGRLLGMWYGVMKDAAEILDRCASDEGLDLEGLVVRRGNDSSTWNEAAGAYNKARDGWVSTIYSLGMEDLLEKFAPPKALRLMAADVVYMHRSFGSGGLEPDTKVWNDLPKPWEVVLGRAMCNRKMIERACKRANIEGKGWIRPRPKTIVPFKPTPELVHGVAVASPELARTLRKAGYFSGPSKGVKPEAPAIPLRRDYSGKTLDVEEGQPDDTLAEMIVEP